MLKRALAAMSWEDATDEEELRWLWVAIQAAVNLWDDHAWEEVAIRWLQLTRDTGVLTVLPLALNGRIAEYALAGELAAAATLTEEVAAVREATGSPVPPYGALILAAWRGREEEVTSLIETISQEVALRGEVYAFSTVEWARALLFNGLGRYEDALTAAERATARTEDLWFHNWGLVELILAGVRSGKTELAATALERLSEITRASGTDWALGIEARSRALLSDGDAAERLYRQAIERLSRTRVRVELARTHLLYGEWLRRKRQRLQAREQLRTSHEMFRAMQIEAFAERAANELMATGERARRRVVETRDDLTAQEAQVARLARDGMSNAEIGARLFISARTVEYHLRKVFTKLGISSRHQLQGPLHAQASQGVPGR
jgi:DNA-binding CsgD family transcriptional regulator